MVKTEVKLSDTERAVLKKYGLRFKDIAEFMSMGERVFLNSTAKERYAKGIAKAILHTEADIIKRLNL